MQKFIENFVSKLKGKALNTCSYKFVLEILKALFTSIWKIKKLRYNFFKKLVKQNL